MKVLVTGATSRQANPLAADIDKKEISFARLLADSLRTIGYEVEHRNPTVLESYDEFDHVFVGLAPLHGLGSNRAYGVLACVLKLWTTGRLSFYVDDPDVGKVTGGLRTMVNNPGNLTKPFFAYKLEADIAHQPEYSKWLQEGVVTLHEQEWPRLLVPAHEWFTSFDVIQRKVPQAAGRIETLDLTSFVPRPEVATPDDFNMRWISEAGENDKWLRRQQPGADIFRIGKNGDKTKVSDKELVGLYRRSLGVLQPPTVPPGWWSSRIAYARHAEVPYVTRWQDVKALGDSYALLPHTIAAMDHDARQELVEEQAKALTACTPTQDECRDVLKSIVESALVGAK